MSTEEKNPAWLASRFLTRFEMTYFSLCSPCLRQAGVLSVANILYPTFGNLANDAWMASSG
jgi:hypothetical protein